MAVTCAVAAVSCAVTQRHRSLLLSNAEHHGSDLRSGSRKLCSEPCSDQMAHAVIYFNGLCSSSRPAAAPVMAVASKPSDVAVLILLGLVGFSQHLGAEIGGLGVEQGNQVGLPIQGVAVVPCQWNRPESGHHSLTLPMHLQHFQHSRRQPSGGNVLTNGSGKALTSTQGVCKGHGYRACM